MLHNAARGLGSANNPPSKPACQSRTLSGLLAPLPFVVRTYRSKNATTRAPPDRVAPRGRGAGEAAPPSDQPLCQPSPEKRVVQDRPRRAAGSMIQRWSPTDEGSERLSQPLAAPARVAHRLRGKRKQLASPPRTAKG